MKSHTMTMTTATPILAVAMLLFVSAASATIPTSISGLDVWLDGSDASTLFQDAAGTNPVTATGDPVALWKDKSGNSNNATAWGGGTPSVPTFTALALGGNSAVTFNGFQGLNNLTYAWPTAVDVFAVVSANSWSSANGYTFILSSKPATYVAGIALTGGAYDGWNTNEVLAYGNNWPSTPTPSTPRVNAPYGTLTNGQAAILDVALSDSVAQIALNGTALTPTYQQVNDTLQTKTGYNVAGREDGLQAWQGNIAELLIFNRKLTAGEANDVGFYLQEKYGIAGAYGPATYNAWVGYWQGIDPTFTNTAGTANPDGDPFDNNEEFAFDGNPTIGTGALLTAVQVGTNAVFNYVAMTNTNAATYVVQNTTNLSTGPWTNSSVTISTSTNQGGISQTNLYLRKEFVVPASGNQFFRVQATITP